MYFGAPLLAATGASCWEAVATYQDFATGQVAGYHGGSNTWLESAAFGGLMQSEGCQAAAGSGNLTSGSCQPPLMGKFSWANLSDTDFWSFAC